MQADCNHIKQMQMPCIGVGKMLNLMCSSRVSIIMMNVHAVQLQHYTAIHMYAYTCIRAYRDFQCYK